MKFQRVAPLISLLVFIAGCSDKVHLSGKVTFSDDGSPLTVGNVCFETDTYHARGPLKSNGTFTVGSTSAKDGLPPGLYRVYITGASEEIGEDDSGMPVTKPLIDSKYSKAETSGLTIDLKKTRRNFDISVDRYVSPKYSSPRKI